MNEPLVHSVKARLKNLAKEANSSFRELWRQLILERFLARLSHSPHRSDLILKGGTLLARLLPTDRETKDLDFLVRGIDNSLPSLRRALEAVCNTPIDDGFRFECKSMATLKHPRMPYTGAQAMFVAHFGQTHTYLPMDLGLGDLVEPIDHSLELLHTPKGPLFEPRIVVRGYPIEFIFSEKLETAVTLGSINTRMKDYHDLYLLTSLPDTLNPKLVDKAIRLTFDHRNTSLQRPLLVFQRQHLFSLQTSWEAYRRGILPSSQSTIPSLFEETIRRINQWFDAETLPQQLKEETVPSA